jgi:medium-chain acyl-[acyl-carrier-protein] hydrolase
MARTPASVWLKLARPSRKSKLRLFCFPYAGSSALIFQGWRNRLPEEIEVSPVQLPGRGTRALEKPYTELLPLVEATAEALLPHLDKPFALFGHSIGAIISFELARSLRRRGAPQPVHLFVSGCRAPQLPNTRNCTYNIPGDDLISELRRLNGTPAEVLGSAEMMQFFLPLIRADLQMVQTYDYSPGSPLNCPISAFGGLQDFDETPEMLAAWREQTTACFQVQMFPGDHFFLHSEYRSLLRTMLQHLTAVTPADR